VDEDSDGAASITIGSAPFQSVAALQAHVEGAEAVADVDQGQRRTLQDTIGMAEANFLRASSRHSSWVSDVAAWAMPEPLAYPALGIEKVDRSVMMTTPTLLQSI